MKKIKLLLMSLMIVTLAACGGDKEPTPTEGTNKDMVEITEQKVQEVDKDAAEMIDQSAKEAGELKDEAVDKVDNIVHDEDFTHEGEKANKEVEKEADEAMVKIHEEEAK